MRTIKSRPYEIHELYAAKGMTLISFLIKNRIENWLMITKVVVAGGIKRVAFTSGNSPQHCWDSMVKAVKEDKMKFKDDTPYQPPIDKS